jgi:serine/threonine-protein kinase
MELGVSDWDKDIKNRFKSSSFYKESELVNILHQIVKALSYLQNKGISHRDVKPQNILIFAENVYKIADFGEAKE